MTRLGLAARAEIESRPARILISGPPGADLVLPALTMAETFYRFNPDTDGPVVFDTERRSALGYAADFDFTHIPWSPPFSPSELAGDIQSAGDAWPVLVIDSLHRFWGDEGGVKDIADGVGRPGRPSGWAAARPEHRKLMTAITEASAHVIACCRPRTDSVLETNPDTGRVGARLVGGDLIQDSLLATDMGVWVTVETDSPALVVAASKIPTIRRGTVWDDPGAFAEVYAAWCDQGEPPISATDASALETAIEALPKDNGLKLRAKVEFFEKFGRPRHLRARDITAARALVAGFQAEAEAKDPATRARDMADRVAGDRPGPSGKDAAADGPS